MSELSEVARNVNGILNKTREKAEQNAEPIKPIKAQVHSLDADGGVYVKTDGDDTVKGPFSTSVKAVIGDRVALRKVGDDWVVDSNLTSPVTDDSRADAAWDKADSAEAAADAASSAASSAQSSADAAGRAASSAQSSADAAAQAASVADGKAAQAIADAAAASTAAGNAATAAANAQRDATTANTAANGALTGLSTVQDIIGVLNWAADNAQFAPTQDTSIVPGKVYWTRSGTSPNYTYTPVANPSESSLSTYYEVDSVDEAMGDYISTHLALTNDGLFVMNDSSGYRLKINSSGWYIIDPQGTTVNQATSSGNDIGPTSGRHIHVGSSTIDMMNGNAVDGWSIGTAIELLKSGASYIWAGLESAVAVVRVGLSTAGNVVLSGDGYVDVRRGSTVLAHFGYGLGNAQSGTANAPYYTLGTRDSSVSDIGNYSVAEGVNVSAISYGSHAEGYNTSASGSGSHAEGGGSSASSLCAHAEGAGTKAIGGYSHAEGYYTKANGDYAHAEGYWTEASTYSHAEGMQTKASGSYGAHAEGELSKAEGNCSHAEGRDTVATAEGQHVEGKWNIKDTSNTYAHIVGNGTNDNARSNAHTLDWSGNAWYAGGVTAAGNMKCYQYETSRSQFYFNKNLSVTGSVTGTSISDGTGTLAQLRESVSHRKTINTWSGNVQSVSLSSSSAYILISKHDDVATSANVWYFHYFGGYYWYTLVNNNADAQISLSGGTLTMSSSGGVQWLLIELPL